MSAESLRTHAERFISSVSRHPRCQDATLDDVSDENAWISFNAHVDMPTHMRADGVSPSCVRLIEKITVRIGRHYPWDFPTFYLRQDFPRDLPHLQPGPKDVQPRPCLVDGVHNEFFTQFGQVEAGIHRLIRQLLLWLQKAAEGTLLDILHGWEPTLRQGLSSHVVLDGSFVRNIVDGRGGFRTLLARYACYDANRTRDPSEAMPILVVKNQRALLGPGKGDKAEIEDLENNIVSGTTVCIAVWAGNQPDGSPVVSDKYQPETIYTLRDLRQRAKELNCSSGLTDALNTLQQHFSRRSFPRPFPIAIVICVRRPYSVIGQGSNIELLPYVCMIQPGTVTGSLFPDGEETPVEPAAQIDAVSRNLLRRVAGTPESAPVTFIGCGSVGSKAALHLARSGVEISSLADKGVLMPHNMARHALVRSPISHGKAAELRRELADLAFEPKIFEGDVVAHILSGKPCIDIVPRHTEHIINTTASQRMREILSDHALTGSMPRISEIVLFGRGNAGVVLIEGTDHNPNLHDLMTVLYGAQKSKRLFQLLHDPEFGLTEVQIGQGCGAYTMPMSDMRLSAMTATLAEAWLEEVSSSPQNGAVLAVNTKSGSKDTEWLEIALGPFSIVPIQGRDNWTLRISPDVVAAIRAEVARYPRVETGGLLIGHTNDRLQVITVVDLLPAPPDSTRSSTKFTLGVDGLKDRISERFRQSGETLADVGTWHSHLTDSGPSKMDWNTANELARERIAPSTLLIAVPSGFHAILGKGE
jgi:E2/UBC family protein A/JAB domain-containing protein similar to deubiquitination enzymes/ThiF family protein